MRIWQPEYPLPPCFAGLAPSRGALGEPCRSIEQPLDDILRGAAASTQDSQDRQLSAHDTSMPVNRGAHKNHDKHQPKCDPSRRGHHLRPETAGKVLSLRYPRIGRVSQRGLQRLNTILRAAEQLQLCAGIVDKDI